MKTTTTEIVTAHPILAIDLGKYKHVACVCPAADDLDFQTLPTGRQELARLLERHRKPSCRPACCSI
jgi:hypothetical protein